MKYGPETETIEAFIRHLKRMTVEQRKTTKYAFENSLWIEARNAAEKAAEKAAEEAVGIQARYAARYAARLASWNTVRKPAGVVANEIQGAKLMRESGQSFLFLRMFGFDNPEAVLTNNKETNDGV